MLSLESRRNGREQMGKMARALGLELRFVEAARKEEPTFGWIAERVLETRKFKAWLMVRSLFL